MKPQKETITMKNRQTTEDGVRGDESLSATFTTGFKKDLETARAISLGGPA